MFLKQFFEPESCTYTYLIADEKNHAVIIDPVESELDIYLKTIQDYDLKLLYIFETHIHADHITAAAPLREKTQAKSVVHRNSNVTCADLLITDGCIFQLGKYSIEAIFTPGHTNACMSYYLKEENIVFTGDTLLINGCGRTDFQHGSSKQLYQSIHTKIFTLPEQTIVYPAHDYHGKKFSTIKEEKEQNVRLGQGKTEAEFIDIMRNLDLPYPKKIDTALPMNQACGQKK